MKVIGKAVLVLPDENPEISTGGIYIPGIAKKPLTGIVIDCGQDCRGIEKGDHIYYDRQGANVIMLNSTDENIEGTEHHFITQEKVKYVYGKKDKQLQGSK